MSSCRTVALRKKNRRATVLQFRDAMDRLLGLSLISGSVTFGIYYTVWVIILSFVEKDSFLQNFFPPKVFAVAIPLLVGVIGLIVIGLFASVTMLQKSRARKLKRS